ncbi:TonB-dependent receptor [Azorhizobium doebereinerae]|uniref:TonB-dependent receptor n=1 Tax=Azorhizobium doebereinerae TaxID=281091 RepID=UPI0003FBCE53|nr:TonB-dependent siderophore receptor [Azorhizobium doebereinerae]
MSANVAAEGIRSSSQPEGLRAALMGSLHLTVGVASAMAAGPALAQQAATGGTELDLPTVQVQGDTGGFVAENTGVTRLPVPIFNMAQQVNVVTQEVMTQQNDVTLEQALRNVSGITFSAGEGGQQGDNPIIRGFSARGDIYRDGIRDPGWYTRDMFDTEQVDIFLGPSSFAFGRGSTGGAINLVSKLPKNATFVNADVTGYTSNGWRTTLDANGKFNDNVYARINLMAQDVDVQDRDNVNATRWGVAPTITAKLSDRTTATLSYYYQHEESVPDYGVPYLPVPTLSTSAANFGQPVGGYYGNGTATAPVPVPRNTWYGVTNGPFADKVTTDTNMVTLQFEHELNDYVTLTNGTRYTANDRLARVTAPRSIGTITGSTTVPTLYPVGSMTIGMQRFQTETDATQFSNITDMVAKFKWGEFEHTLNAGVEITRETRDQERYNLCSPTVAACRVSLINPIDVSANLGVGGYPSYLPSTTNGTTMTDVAIYGADQIKLNKYWQIMGGVRLDNAATDYDAVTITNNGAASSAVPLSLNSNDQLFNYKVGVIFSPIETVNLYATYGTSSNPSAEYGVLDNGTATLAPEKNSTAEAGVKAMVLDGRVTLSGALFQTMKTNTRVATDGTADLPPTVLGGEQRVQGYSLSVGGALTKEWNVTASFTHLDTEILSVDPLATAATRATVGKELPNAPPNSFSFWTAYNVTQALLVGFGGTYNDATYANVNNTVYVPSYWAFDAMASYQITKNFQVQVNVYNLTDELYYAQYYGGQAVPAAGRTATLTARATF